MGPVYLIEPESPSLEALTGVFYTGHQLALSADSTERINQARSFLLNKIKTDNEPVYGVNTGFGSLCQVSIPIADLAVLQQNMVHSHACGMGAPIPAEVVKMMLLLKIQALAKGFSGVSLQTVNRLIDFYNHDIMPVVFEQGSLGASGDLAPLAHLAMPLIGSGEVVYRGEKRPAGEVLREKNWQPLTLGPKEGLALLNGTQFMNAYLVLLCDKASRLLNWAEAVSAISIDAFLCRYEPLHPLLQKVRQHKSQERVAAQLRYWLEGSEIGQQKKIQVQDPYSFRCIPQVLGASRQVLAHATVVAAGEVAAVTDNPLVFAEEGLILSGGNFHGQPLAFALDYLCMALHEAGSISERRVYQLVSGKRDLPAFLVANPGLNSGLMIVQYLAASIVSQNKQLCTPASVDSIESSAGQEDHVSMGANAAVKAWQVATNLEKLISAELFTSTQAIEFRRPLKSSPLLERLITDYRREVPAVNQDRIFHHDLLSGVEFIRKYKLPLAIN